MRSILLSLGIGLVAFNQAYSADNESAFVITTSDQQISGTTPISFLSYNLVLAQTKTVLLVANGRFYPYVTNGMAIVNIQVDGIGISNSSIIEWNTTVNAVQHSFDCMGYLTLTAGTHIVRLVGNNHPSTPSAKFITGAGAGLSIMVNPAPNVQLANLSSDSPVIDENTYGLGSYANLPTVTLLTNNVNPVVLSNVFTLLSGRSYCAGGQGDALWGIYLNNQCPSNNSSNWAVNDIFNGAEMHAPMACFAMHNLTGGNAISFKASELSYDAGYPADLVQYRVGGDVQMISLWGAQVSGSAVNSMLSCNRVDWKCIGSSSGYGGCAAAGSNSLIAQTTFNIPAGHNGIVFFKGAARLQGDPNDAGGNVAIWFNIDGVDVGATGLQQLKSPNCVSERMIGASYLSAGNNKLAAGQHTVSLFGRADGNFIHVVTTNELPLIYFD